MRAHGHDSALVIDEPTSRSHKPPEKGCIRSVRFHYNRLVAHVCCDSHGGINAQGLNQILTNVGWRAVRAEVGGVMLEHGRDKGRNVLGAWVLETRHAPVVQRATQRSE